MSYKPSALSASTTTGWEHNLCKYIHAPIVLSHVPLHVTQGHNNYSEYKVYVKLI